jgi:hypothetical protein
LAEGLARTVAEGHAGIAPPDRPYEAYVAAYGALARVIGAGVEQLWRLLWLAPPGQVRERFPDALAEVAAPRLRPLHQRHRARFQAIGDRVFASDRERDTQSETALMRTWELALR